MSNERLAEFRKELRELANKRGQPLSEVAHEMFAGSTLDILAESRIPDSFDSVKWDAYIQAHIIYLLILRTAVRDELLTTRKKTPNDQKDG